MGEPLDNFYTTASGTSMATPHASGTSALLLQALAQANPQQIKDALMQTAQDLGLDANTQGKGRADVFAAYSALIVKPPQPPTPQPQTPEPPPSQPPPPTPPPQPPTPQPPAPGGGCGELIKSLLRG